MDNWIPILTSQAGSSLTFANWKNAGIRTVSVHLSALLMKPGLEMLKTLPNLRRFCAWPHQIILNASLPFDERQQAYRFRSLYDGQEIKLDKDSVVSLAKSLNADKVVFPWESNEMIPLHCGEDLSFETLLQKIACVDNSATTLNTPTRGVGGEGSKTFYLTGDFSYDQLIILSAYKNCLIESDRAAQDGMQGMVFGPRGSGMLNILDAEMREDMNLIDEACLCETCTAKLSRGYLHHLLQHTPLLCSRFLMQHNIWKLRTSTFT